MSPRRRPTRTLFAHHIDLDGLSTVLVSNMQHTLKINRFIGFNYDEVTPELVAEFGEYTDIYIADITLPFDDTQWLLDKGCNVTVIDHHEKAYEGDVDSGERGLKEIDHPNFIYSYSNEKCGTLLWYEYCKAHNWIETTPQLDYAITLVDLYDRFQETHELFPEAENLNRVFWKLQKYYLLGIPRYKEFLDDMEKKLRKDQPFEFNMYEKQKIKEVITRENDLTKKALRHMKVRYDDRGVKFGVISLPSKISKASSNIFKLRSDITYIVAVNTFKEAKLSLRSKGFNLLQLEGVKGHTDAAGTDHELYPPEFCKRFLKEDLSIKYIRPKPTRRR